MSFVLSVSLLPPFLSLPTYGSWCLHCGCPVYSWHLRVITIESWPLRLEQFVSSPWTDPKTYIPWTAVDEAVIRLYDASKLRQCRRMVCLSRQGLPSFFHYSVLASDRWFDGQAGCSTYESLGCNADWRMLGKLIWNIGRLDFEPPRKAQGLNSSPSLIFLPILQWIFTQWVLSLALFPIRHFSLACSRHAKLCVLLLNCWLRRDYNLYWLIPSSFLFSFCYQKKLATDSLCGLRAIFLRTLW